FSPETLQSIRSVYAALDNIPPNELLLLQPQKESLYFRTRDTVRAIHPNLVNKAGPMELWQWLGLVFVFVIAFVLGNVLNLLLQILIARLLHRRSQTVPLNRGLLLWSLRLLALGVCLRLSDSVLSYPDLVQVALVALGLSCLTLSSM